MIKHRKYDEEIFSRFLSFSMVHRDSIPNPLDFIDSRIKNNQYIFLTSVLDVLSRWYSTAYAKFTYNNKFVSHLHKTCRSNLGRDSGNNMTLHKIFHSFGTPSDKEACGNFVQFSEHAFRPSTSLCSSENFENTLSKLSRFYTADRLVWKNCLKLLTGS